MKNMYLSLLPFLFIAVCGMSIPLSAEEASADNAQQLIIKPGDKIYFRLTDVQIKDSVGKKVEQPILTFWEKRSKDDFNKIEIPKSQEILLTYTPDANYQMDVKNDKKGVARSIQTISSADFFKQLGQVIQQHTEERGKWTVSFVSKDTKESVTLTFAGVQRFYELKSVSVPEKSNYRHKSTNPTLHVSIIREGKSVQEMAADRVAWAVSFPSNPDSKSWEVREGTSESFDAHLYLRTWTGKQHLMDILAITDMDLAKEKVLEKMASDGLSIPGESVEMTFQRIDSGINAANESSIDWKTAVIIYQLLAPIR